MRWRVLAATLLLPSLAGAQDHCITVQPGPGDGTSQLLATSDTLESFLGLALGYTGPQDPAQFFAGEGSFRQVSPHYWVVSLLVQTDSPAAVPLPSLPFPWLRVRLTDNHKFPPMLTLRLLAGLGERERRGLIDVDLYPRSPQVQAEISRLARLYDNIDPDWFWERYLPLRSFRSTSVPEGRAQRVELHFDLR